MCCLKKFVDINGPLIFEVFVSSPWQILRTSRILCPNVSTFFTGEVSSFCDKDACGWIRGYLPKVFCFQEIWTYRNHLKADSEMGN